MLKTFKRLFLLVIVLLLMKGMSVFAYPQNIFAEIPMQKISCFSTVLTDTEGDFHTLDGVLDLAAFEKSPLRAAVASYTIRTADGRELLSVELGGKTPVDPLFYTSTDVASGGYYKTDFLLSASENTHAFLTGLTQEKIETVQAKILENALAGRNDFSIEDIDFIDAEKTLDAGDDNLCWAASAANMLHYSGWGAQAGFANEDALFEEFVSSFTDGGLNQDLALQWFFNGENKMQGYGANGWAQADAIGKAAAKLPAYDANAFVEAISCSENPIPIIANLTAALRNDCAVGLGLHWQTIGSGHAITAWGYLYDADFPILNEGHYLGLFISDSDSDKNTTERETAPNRLRMLWMSRYRNADYDTWEFDTYQTMGRYTGYLSSITILKPYTASASKETHPSATLDRTTSPDLLPTELVLTTEDDIIRTHTFLKGETLSPSFHFANQGATLAHSHLYAYRLTLTTPSGETPPYEYSFSLSSFPSFNFVSFEKDASIVLNEVGTYQLSIEVFSTSSLKEAFFSNNKISTSFEVIDPAKPQIVSQSKVRGTVQTYLPTGTTQNAHLLIASYDKDGALCSVRFYPTAAPLQNGLKNIIIHTPAGALNKALLWDTTTLKPLCKPFILE